VAGRADGEPLGPPRRVTSESAHAPQLGRRTPRHILYQSVDKLRIVDVRLATRAPFRRSEIHASGSTTRLVVHAGKLVDMKSAATRSNVDIVSTGNTITKRRAARRRKHTPETKTRSWTRRTRP